MVGQRVTSTLQSVAAKSVLKRVFILLLFCWFVFRTQNVFHFIFSEMIAQNLFREIFEKGTEKCWENSKKQKYLKKRKATCAHFQMQCKPPARYLSAPGPPTGAQAGKIRGELSKGNKPKGVGPSVRRAFERVMHVLTIQGACAPAPARGPAPAQSRAAPSAR